MARKAPESQEKDTVITKLKERIKLLSRNVNVDKVKMDMDEIETLNIELDHMNDLRKLKGKALVDDAVTKHTIDPEMLKIDVEPITPKLLNKRTAHSSYIKHTQEEAVELLTNISKTCPSINNFGEKSKVVTTKNKDKRVRFTESVTSLGNINTKPDLSSNLVSNKPVLSSTGLGVAVCTTVGITSEEEDASESFFGIKIPKNGSLFMCDGASCSTVVEECEPVDAAGSGATTSSIRAMTSGAGQSTLDGRLSNSSNNG
ncbi:hypothetical protein Tco_1420909 [Tanacetum coccineum]